MPENTTMPTRKVASGAVAGALSTVAIWIATEWLAMPEPSPEIAVAFSTLITFVLQYVIRDA